MDEDKGSLPPGLYEKIADYIQTRIRIGKLSLIEKSSELSVSLVLGILMGFLSLLVLFLLGFGLAELISYRNGDNYSGFFVVGSSFLVLLILIYIFKNQISRKIQNPIIRFLSKLLMDHEGE